MRGPQDLLAWRAEFPAAEARIFLGSHTLAPLSRRSRAAIERFLDVWESKASAELVWFEDIIPEMRRLEALYARLIGADHDEVALTPSVTTGLASLASCLAYGDRDEIVLSSKEFPTDCHVWLAQQERGAKIVWSDAFDGELVASEIGPRTAACSVSRVSYLNGELIDLGPILDRCRTYGALSIVDDFHGSGTVPIDVHALGADALVAGPLKYLLGGPGIAFIYARRDVIPRLRPSITGWFGQENFFEFDNSSLVRPLSAQRFALGTPSPASIFAAAAGLEIVLEVGLERIRERVQDLIDYAIERAGELGFAVRTPHSRDRRGGLIAVEVPESKRTLDYLLRSGIVVDERHGAVRASPHFFSSEDDIDRLFEGLVAARNR